MNEIDCLVKNFVAIARERIIALFIFSFVLVHFKLVPKFCLIFLALILAIHMVQMYFVNQAFQSHFENKRKHAGLIQGLNLVSLMLCVLYLTTLIFVAFL
jgi:hypothetical protein